MKQGLVNKIVPSTTSKGQPYLRIQIMNDWYSLFDTLLFAQCKEGANVVFEYKESGDFKNITSITPAGTTNNAPLQAFNSKPRETTMQKCNALNNSVNLMRIMSDLKVLQAQEATPERAMQIAERFMAWIHEVE